MIELLEEQPPFLERLTEEQLRDRQRERIEDMRLVHSVRYERPPEPWDYLLNEARRLSNLSRLAAREHAMLGVPKEDGSDYVEDERCPFCPPYSLPLDATWETIQQTLS